MKKTLKILLFVLLILILIASFFLGYALIISSKETLDINKLKKTESAIVCIYDINNNELKQKKQNVYVPFSEINKSTIDAFVSIEDKRFYKHNGIDNKAVIRALFNNIKDFSFNQGASTITQQLVKNTHLTNKKTIKRKIIEGKIAMQLEKKFSKNEIIEMYLNNIYFGDNCYGIYSASNHYFNKEPKDLTVNESAYLAGIVKSPFNYSPTKNSEKSFTRKNIVLKEMYTQGYISKNQYDTNILKKEIIKLEKDDYLKDYNYFLYNELDNIIEEKKLYGKKIKIYTTIDQKYQDILLNNLYNFQDLSDSSSGIIMNKNGGIMAYSSNLGEVKRQVGSIIKPILIYAPAFENNVINQTTILNDEKTYFDGLNITNYQDRYYGKITAKKSLMLSSNTCSAKILNSVGIENAKRCIKNLPLQLTNDDNTLLLSIGSTKEGQTLSNITNSYLPFLNNGIYKKCFIIDRIEGENGNIIYKNNNSKIRIFGEDTTYLINDTLNACVKDGTAKRLKNVSKNLCSKTGTVGNENGNMDAYSIVYDTNVISSVWLGNENGELMKNSVTGGTYPSIINANIFDEIYSLNQIPNFFDIPKSIKRINLDYYSLYNDEKEEQVLDDVPKKYIESALFKKSNIPNLVSNRFSNPNIENVKLLANINGFDILLCHADYIEYLIYDECNGIKKCIYDSKTNGNKKLVSFNICETNYSHKISIIPYFNTKKGNEILVGVIKSQNILNDDWWIN